MTTTNDQDVYLDRRRVDAISEIVLVHRTWNKLHPYVTWYEDKNGARFYGHYHTDLEDAREDFETRGLAQVKVRVVQL